MVLGFPHLGAQRLAGLGREAACPGVVPCVGDPLGLLRGQNSWKLGSARLISKFEPQPMERLRSDRKLILTGSH